MLISKPGIANSFWVFVFIAQSTYIYEIELLPMYKCFLSTLILLILCFSGCKHANNNAQETSTDTTTMSSFTVILPKRAPSLSQDSIFTNDYNFIADTLMHGHKGLVKYYIQKYAPDCRPNVYAKAELKEAFEGFKFIGKLKPINVTDSVFVLYPLSLCEDGQSYYFTDTALPRLQTDSHCCHPDNIFSVGDIDEDGICEIGQYYSSCSSHYKSLYVFTLKNKAWKQVGHSVFDQHYMKYDVPFASYVRKTGKGEFEMHEISDLSDDSTKKGIDGWLKFSF